MLNIFSKSHFVIICEKATEKKMDFITNLNQEHVPSAVSFNTPVFNDVHHPGLTWLSSQANFYIGSYYQQLLIELDVFVFLKN